MAIGLLSLVLTDLNFNPLPGQDGPILANIDGDVVLTSIDNFPAHKMTLMGADVRAIKSIDPNILPCGCIITEEGMGEVARGYIEDPAAQINDQGHTITLSIPNVTESLRWDTTAPGWVAATGIDTIVNRLASRCPPWTASVVDTGAPVVSVSPVHWQGNDPSVSNADLNTFTKNDNIGFAWNVGALTQEFFSSGDGAITSVAFGCNTYRMFGFTNNFSTYSYEMLNHAIYFATDGLNKPTSGILAVYESGVLAYKGAPGSYYPGDVASVAVVNGVVQYSLNNIVFYTSTVPPAYNCYGACSIYSASGAIIGATMTSYVAPKDTYYAVGFENATILDAELQVAQRTFRHIRQKQVNGIPQRALEIGLFNAPPTMVLKTADAESPAQMRSRNQYTRLISPQVDYSYQTSQIISIGAAFGGGTGDTQVRLRNLYDYLHPATGSPPAKVVPTNGNPPYYPLFPEYDDVNFPIERRVALNGTYYYVIKNVALIAAIKAKGHWSGEIWGAIDDSSIIFVDHSADAQQQAVERTLYVSCVTKLKRHAALHFVATLSTEGRGRITQAGDQVNVQIARTGTTRSATGVRSFQEANINVNPMVTMVTRKYRDNDITDDWQVSTLGRLLTDDSTALTDTLRGLEAVRLLPTSGSQTVLIGPIEQTINSVFPLDIPVSLPNTMGKMTAASLKVILKPARHNVRLTQGAQLDGLHDHAVTIPPLTVNIFPLPSHNHTSFTPYHSHGGISGNLTTTGSTDIAHSQGTSTPAGRTGGLAKTGGINNNNVDLSNHFHVLVNNNLVHTPASNDGSLWTSSSYTYVVNGRTYRTLLANSSAPFISATGGHEGFNGPDMTSHAHSDNIAVNDTLAVTGGGTVNNLGTTLKGLSGGQTPINFATTGYSAQTWTAADNGGNLIGMTTVQNVFTHATDGGALSGGHTHNLFPDVQETNLGGYFQVWINSGDGVYVDRSPELGGPWQASMEVKGNVSLTGTGMERFLQAPGKSVGIRIVAVNSASNITGICNVQVSGTWEFDKYAISQTIFAGVP